MLLGGVAVANAILNLVLNVVFAVTLGIGGIALSTSVTVLILLLFLAIRLSEPGFVLSDVLRYTLRALVASAIVVVPSLVATQFVPSGLGLGLAPVLAVLALFTALAYPWVARRLGVTEPMIVVRVAAETGRRFLG
jgi:peptidoglycan biosynthesis protein MviN/MurJ (putative lipid II flippase)